MNEKIKELAEQAISDVDGIQNPDTQHMYIPDCFAEKFAELIVKECMKLNSNELSITAIERLLPRYTEHFGFKE